MVTYYKKSDFEVGQEVVRVKKQYGWGNGFEEEVTIAQDIVTKVGRKYITTDRARFVLDENRIFSDNGYGASGDLYPNIESYKEHKKRDFFTTEIGELFSYANRYNIGRISNEQIFAIADILGIEYKGEDENASEKNE